MHIHILFVLKVKLYVFKYNIVKWISIWKMETYKPEALNSV